MTDSVDEKENMTTIQGQETKVSAAVAGIKRPAPEESPEEEEEETIVFQEDNGSASISKDEVPEHDGEAEQEAVSEEVENEPVEIKKDKDPEQEEGEEEETSEDMVENEPEEIGNDEGESREHESSKAVEEDSAQSKQPAEEATALLLECSKEKLVAADIAKLRPVKRARSAYFIFMDERRPHVQKQHPGEGVAAVARALGQSWSAMSDDEKKPYQMLAAAEREQVTAAMQAWKTAGGVEPDIQLNARNNNGTLTFPAARIRKIVKLDPDVKGLSKEALLLVTKAAELALAKLGAECVKTAAIQNRRKLLPDDVASVCSHREQFLFLHQDITDLHRQQQKEAKLEAAASSQSKQAKGGAMQEPAASKNGKPLTDYFAKAS